MNDEMDRRLRQLAREQAETAPQSLEWDGVVERASEPASTVASGRWPVVAAAAVLIVVGVAVVAAVRTADAPASSTESSATATSPTGSSEVHATIPSVDNTTGNGHVAAAPEGLRANCDGMAFDLMGDSASFSQLPTLDSDGAAALEFAVDQGVPSDFEPSNYDWRLGPSDPDRPDWVRLLGIPEPMTSGPFATAAVRRDGDSFQTVLPGVGAVGYCNMTIEANGWSVATLAVDPTQTDDSTSSVLRILANETACAGGRTPPLDDVYTRVDETSSTISILVLIRTPDGGQTCPSNPDFTLEISLDAPLGTRTITDAGVIPAAPVR